MILIELGHRGMQTNIIYFTEEFVLFYSNELIIRDILYEVAVLFLGVIYLVGELQFHARVTDKMLGLWSCLTDDVYLKEKNICN